MRAALFECITEPKTLIAGASVRWRRETRVVRLDPSPTIEPLPGAGPPTD